MPGGPMGSKAETSRERAQIALALYFQKGPGRSLRKLHAQLRSLRVPISLATLKRYSVRFGWAQEIERLAAEARVHHQERGIEQVLAMNDRHAQLARALQGVGGSALQRL